MKYLSIHALGLVYVPYKIDMQNFSGKGLTFLQEENMALRKRRGRDPRVLEIYKGEGEGGIWDGSSLGASLTDWSGSSVNQEFTFKM